MALIIPLIKTFSILDNIFPVVMSYISISELSHDTITRGDEIKENCKSIGFRSSDFEECLKVASNGDPPPGF